MEGTVAVIEAVFAGIVTLIAAQYGLQRAGLVKGRDSLSKLQDAMSEMATAISIMAVQLTEIDDNVKTLRRQHGEEPREGKLESWKITPEMKIQLKGTAKGVHINAAMIVGLCRMAVAKNDEERTSVIGTLKTAIVDYETTRREALT